MSRIEELIEKLCPDGVEFKTLDKVCSVETGSQLNKDSLLEIGEYPVMNGGINPSGYWNEYNTKKDTIIISQGGASAGFTQYMTTPFWAGAHCYRVKLLDLSVNYKYLYYFIKNNQSSLIQNQVGAGIPSVSRTTLYKLQIPVPPVEIQEEIVKILDNFTELTAELTAELTVRKQQYEYYRDSLLTFSKDDSSVQWMNLGDISNKIFSGKNLNRTENGTYTVYGSTGAIAKTDNYVYDKEQILVARVGANAGFVYIASGKYDVSDNTLIVDLDENKCMKFIYYILVNLNLRRFAKGGGQPLITAGQLKEIEIPIPSIEKQKQIVEILDNFSKLCEDISGGLPAEIEARQKQYEYYRDKLLTFKEKKV